MSYFKNFQFVLYIFKFIFQPERAIQIGINISPDKSPSDEIMLMFDDLARQQIQLSVVNK